MPPQQGRLPQPPPQTESFESKISSKSSFRKYLSRKRRWLCAGAVVLLLVMSMGIVFAAHHYYVDFGGQGFLKVRYDEATVEYHAIKAYLPLRKLVTLGGNGSRIRRSPMEVPYQTCGDQQSSCEAYNQPDICCPVKMSCRSTSLTPSNIYCCNANEPDLVCEASWNALPKCLPSYFQCLEEEGGGCCPTNSFCSPNGCITTTGPTIINAPTGTTTLNGPITITEVPAATMTMVKQGEVAQSGVGPKDSVVIKLCLPYSCVSFLVFVAALMGFL